MKTLSKEQLYTIRAVLTKYGVEEQERQCMEECAELIQALNKHHRKRCDKSAVVEEIADVMIMCEQMALSFGYDDVMQEIDAKIARLKKRMETTQGND